MNNLSLPQLQGAERQAQIIRESAGNRFLRVGMLHGFGNWRIEKHKHAERHWNAIRGHLDARIATIKRENEIAREAAK